MNEVSCRVLEPFFRAADRRGISRDELVRGVPYQRAHLENKHERLDYEAFERVMANSRHWFTDDDIVAIGAEGIASPAARSLITIGRTIMTPVGFYRWMLSAGGVGNQMFTNVQPTFREVAPGHFVVELRIAAGYRPSREFLLMTRGGMEAVSDRLGLGRSARVQMTFTERGARYDVQVPQERSIRAGVVKFLTRPRDARVAATELDDAMRALEARYAELEIARNAIERQRSLLDTAYRLGHQIWGELEPSAIGIVVVNGLVSVTGIAGARLGDAIAGEPGDREHAVSVDLIGRGVSGWLEAWVGADGSRDDVRALLELLAPTVALAIANAVAYAELATYQRGLEELVEQRTTELRGARDELAELVGKLRDAQNARERIFANISHEIRTPLSVIMLAVGDVEARAGGGLDDRARADLATVVDSTRRLLRLVDELLLLAAGQEHELRVATRATDLGALIAALVATWRPAAESAGLTLQYRGDEHVPAMVDPVAIERVLSNLVSNAIKFTPSGRIDIELATTEVEISIAVRDTGLGIDDDLAQRLFGRFERGSNAQHARGGSGIGLSLVRELVEAHHGHVTAERLRGGGTEFKVTLPWIAPSAAPVDSQPLRLRPSDFGVTAAPIDSGTVLTPPGPSRATLLVAEDDPRLANMIARLLAEEHTVVVALDGLAALELAARHRPHLLVTDVDMPGMDGIELTRRFREQSGDRLAPVVILSALADLGDRVAGLEAGATDYVTKPFNPSELRARVRAQLTMRELALRLHRAEQLSALGTLSSGLAHELRNPANAIVNAVGPLKALLPPELLGPDHAVGQLVDVLAGCAEQVAFLSRQLLSFRRGGDLDLKPASIGELLQRAITLAQPSLREVAVRDRVDLVEPIRCAPPLMVQVLTNLIENAAHAAGAGGWIEIAGRTHDGRVIVEVADSGPGVPVELRDRVFEPFFTTKPPGIGTGLGLPLARDILHRHGGILEIRERDGRAVFVIELPR